MFEDENARIREVINGEEFATRLAGSPYGDRCRTGRFRFVHAANKRRRHVAMLRMVVVAGPVEVGGHDRNEIGAVLSAVGFDQLDTGDFCQRVPLIGRFERSGEQHVLAHWLGRQSGINAG
jgi:hypothetical protein